MAQIRLLLGQTFWYGLSSLVARFLNYLLTPYLTGVLLQADYGEMSIVYATIPFFLVVFMQGLETAYFRFGSNHDKEQRVYNTASSWLIISTIALFLVLVFFRNGIASLVNISEHPEYITMSACIIALDTLGSLAFARLRFHSRSRKFAFVRIAGILLNILLVVFFISVCPWLEQHHPGSFLLFFYSRDIGLGYIFIANILQSAFCLLLLLKEFTSFRFEFNFELWKKIMLYSLPLVIIGICNAVNETADRIMLGWWQQGSSLQSVKEEVGTYSACSKLSALITIAIYAFRLGAEPFFFKVAENEQQQKVYGRVMNYFVIVICTMFLLVSLNLEIWKYFIQNPAMWTGLKAVPVMLFGNILLGINYNLSIWFKLTGKTMAGAVISIAGAMITVIVNYLFIPSYGYMACAWASVACYAVMVVISYSWGKSAYPISYPLWKMAGYISLAVAIFLIHWLIRSINPAGWLYFTSGLLLLFLFFVIVYRAEKEGLKKLPLLNKIPMR